MSADHSVANAETGKKRRQKDPLRGVSTAIGSPGWRPRFLPTRGHVSPQGVASLLEEGQRLPRRTVGSKRVRWAAATYGAVHDFLTNLAVDPLVLMGR